MDKEKKKFLMRSLLCMLFSCVCVILMIPSYLFLDSITLTMIAFVLSMVPIFVWLPLYDKAEKNDDVPDGAGYRFKLLGIWALAYIASMVLSFFVSLRWL